MDELNRRVAVACENRSGCVPYSNGHFSWITAFAAYPEVPLIRPFNQFGFDKRGRQAASLGNVHSAHEHRIGRCRGNRRFHYLERTARRSIRLETS